LDLTESGGHRPIVGVRNAQQVDGVIGAAEIALNSNDLLEIYQSMALQPP